MNDPDRSRVLSSRKNRIVKSNLKQNNMVYLLIHSDSGTNGVRDVIASV